MSKTEESLVTGEEWNESDEVLRRRYHEALAAGLGAADAHVFAASGSDIGVLRKAVRGGCPPTLLARILL